MKIATPEKVNRIISTLAAAGHEAYAVGGCVRDAVLGREPADWDITTSALPAEVKALFPRTVDTGIQHGTVTVLLGHEGFEVTTYRVDGLYEDGRHPSEVTFTGNLIEDLKRRDFTINAMAWNEESGLIDAFDGMRDLEKGIIRCVGDARERFSEDALRMLRAVRFSAQLGFELEERTRDAIMELRENLTKVSAERIQVELVKLITSPHPERLLTAWETGLTAIMLPEFDACMACEQHTPHHIYSVGMHTIHSMQEVEPDKILRLTMLLHDIGKPVSKTTDEQGVDHFKGHPVPGEEIAGKILRRLRFDNDTTRTVKKLVLHHDYRPALTPTGVRRAANRIGEELFPLYLKVQRADTLAQSPATQPEKLARIAEVERLYKKILEEKNCFTLKQLAVTGRDLMGAGIPAGPVLGEILQRLLDLVIEEPERNEREWLLGEAKKIYENQTQSDSAVARA
ncbi:MAG: CCA tRNA nucleotidyltransferase [Lachnospiraceae bacterium]|nr:CCA tRNA nucleotidyltransferase [Lachnospiraceae bacterium]